MKAILPIDTRVASPDPEVQSVRVTGHAHTQHNSTHNTSVLAPTDRRDASLQGMSRPALACTTLRLAFCITNSPIPNSNDLGEKRGQECCGQCSGCQGNLSVLSANQCTAHVV